MAQTSVVLLDFHNTLVRCDSWFALEVRELAGAVLRRIDAGATDAQIAHANSLYHAMRQEVQRSGREVDTPAAVAAILERPRERESVTRIVDHLERETLDDIALMPGVADTLADLRVRGLRLAVVSNAAWPVWVAAALDKLGIAAYFEQIITSAGCGYYKSDPTIYHKALAALGGVTPEVALHVGDSHLYDVVGAQRAGLRALWYNPDAAAPPDQSRIDAVLAVGAGAWRGAPDGIISSFDALTAWL